MFEGSGTPWLSPAELGAMGFRHVSFPVSIMFRVVGAMKSCLADLRAHAMGQKPLEPMPDAADVRSALDEAVDLTRWRQIESSFGPEAKP
jgi:2-methylisocitrate lyase-like PEP mutase family enzyme